MQGDMGFGRNIDNILESLVYRVSIFLNIDFSIENFNSLFEAMVNLLDVAAQSEIFPRS